MKTDSWVGMLDAGPRQMLLAQTIHPRPGPAGPAALAATEYLAQPELRHLRDELIQAAEVSRYRVVTKPATRDAREPTARFAKRVVATLLQLLFDRGQGATHPFGNRLPLQRESLRPSRLPADVREAEKIERLTATPPFTLSLRRATTAKLNQAGLVGMKAKVKVFNMVF